MPEVHDPFSVLALAAYVVVGFGVVLHRFGAEYCCSTPAGIMLMPWRALVWPAYVLGAAIRLRRS